MARKLRVFAWFNFLTPSPFLPFHSFPSHRVFLRHITVHRSLTLPNPNSFSPPYSTLVFIPLLSPFLPLPIFSSYSLNPRPGTSLLHWSHSLPPSFAPPTDLPLSSSTFFPFPLHPSPSHPSPHILRSPPFAPHAPPIPLLPFTTPCLPPPTDLPYLPSLFFLSPSIILLPTPLLIFSVPLPSHPTPLPFPSLLSLLHVLLLLLQTSPIFFYSFSFPLFSSYSPFSSFHTLHPSYRSSPIFLHSFSFPPPSFSFPPLSSYSPFASLHTLHPSHSPPSSLSLPHVLPPPIDLPLSSFTLFPFPLHRSPSYPSPRILRSRPSIPYTPPISLLPFTASCPSSSYRPSPLLSPLPSYPSLVMPPQAPMPYFPHAFPFCSFSTRIQLCYYYC